MEDEFAIEIAIKLEDTKSNSAKDNREGISFDPLVIIRNFFGLVFCLDEIFVKILVVVVHWFYFNIF